MIIPYESKLDMIRAKEIVAKNKGGIFDLIKLQNKIVKAHIKIRKMGGRKKRRYDF